MKMARTRSALLALTALMISIVVPGCSESVIQDIVTPPRIEGITSRITGIDFGGVNLEFDAKIANSLPVSIKAPKFRYTMELDGKTLASGLHQSGFDLPAGGTGVATLPVRLSFADVYSLATSLKDKSEAGYRLAGAFIIPALGREFELPLSHSGTFPILKPPTFNDFFIEKPEISLGGAKFSIKAKIANPNAFRLGIDGMGYNVMLGEIPMGSLRASTASTVEAGESTELALSGEVSLISAAFQLLSGAKPGETKISPTGAIETPWGKVNFSGGR